MDNPYEKFRDDLRTVLQNKIEEFKLLGYESITEDELWKYLITKKWRKPKEEEIQIHKVVNDILSLKVSDYINYTQVSYLQEDVDWFSTGGSSELDALLGK